MSDKTKPTRINQKRFVRLFKDTLVEESNMRFCFFLGVGASRSSGIQTQSDLITQWFNEITEDLEVDELQNWLTTTGINEHNANDYPQQIIKKRFEFEPDICDKVLYQHSTDATPGIGYLILAQILNRTSHNLAITCNSDYLIEDALFSAASIAPILLGQTMNLTESILQTLRPMVYRIESDVCDATIHTSTDNQYHEGDINFLKDVTTSFRPILIGHSGKQSRLIHYLSQLSSKDRQPIFWCTRDIDNIPKNVLKLLTYEDYIVEIEGFDPLMFQIISAFSQLATTRHQHKKYINLDHFKEDYLIHQAKKKAIKYEELLDEFEIVTDPINSETSNADTLTPMKNIIDDKDQINDFMMSLKSSSSDDEDIYKQALKKEPLNATYNMRYAIYLEGSRGMPSQATEYFTIAIRSAPYDEKIKVLYAFLLNHHLQDYDEAEKLYTQAFEIAPENLAINILFGIFLHNIRKKYIAAEKNFKMAYKAIESKIDYTDFVKDIRMNYHATEVHYKKLIEEEFTEASIV